MCRRRWKIHLLGYEYQKLMGGLCISDIAFGSNVIDNLFDEMLKLLLQKCPCREGESEKSAFMKIIHILGGLGVQHWLWKPFYVEETSGQRRKGLKILMNFFYEHFKNLFQMTLKAKTALHKNRTENSLAFNPRGFQRIKSNFNFIRKLLSSFESRWYQHNKKERKNDL